MITCECLNGAIIIQQNVLLCNEVTDVYARQIYESASGTCKLRSIRLRFQENDAYDEFEHILRLYPHLEQIVFDTGNEKKILKFLPRFIDNGLKDLKIFGHIEYENAKKICNIGMNLRNLYLTFIIHKINDYIASYNKLQLPKNVKLHLLTHPTTLALLNENLLGSAVLCHLAKENEQNNDNISIVKMKNLEEMNVYELVRSVSLLI